MIVDVVKRITINAFLLKLRSYVRYWEDSTVNGNQDFHGYLIPCKEGDVWCPEILVDSGRIINWQLGKTAVINYKTCDDNQYELVDHNKNSILKKEGYVLNCLSITDNGYGDYIKMNINEHGFIENWNFTQSDVNDMINGI